MFHGHIHRHATTQTKVHTTIRTTEPSESVMSTVFTSCALNAAWHVGSKHLMCYDWQMQLLPAYEEGL